METDEIEEYQQNEIDSVHDDLKTRRRHISGLPGHGLLDGDRMRKPQNDRAEAYLEGYADALAFAADQVVGIENMARYLPEDDEGGEDDGE